MPSEATITIPGTETKIPRTPALLIAGGIAVVVILLLPKQGSSGPSYDADTTDLSSYLPEPSTPAVPGSATDAVRQKKKKKNKGAPTMPGDISGADQLSVMRQRLAGLQAKINKWAAQEEAGTLDEEHQMKLERARRTEGVLMAEIAQMGNGINTADVMQGNPV